MISPYNQPEHPENKSDENPSLERVGLSADQRAEQEKAECRDHHQRAGTLATYNYQFPFTGERQGESGLGYERQDAYGRNVLDDYGRVIERGGGR